MFFAQAAAAAGAAYGQSASSTPPQQALLRKDRVVLAGDGVPMDPAEYVALLADLIRQHGAKADAYLKGGAVEELEQRFAKLLGKERALFFPTGTLANHVAVRILAARSRRVLVQEESHLYRDEGDCAQTLSGLNLVPLAPGRATIRAAEIAEAVDRATMPPYPVPIGAISLECPVRRTDGRAFQIEELKKISALARERRIGLHLDGARLFLASAYTGIPPAGYAALFDTVYVSLYKYFGAPFGAVLAGSEPMMAEAAILRHQFGGAVLHGWEPALVALHGLDGFEERYRKAVRAGDEVLRRLAEKHGFEVHRFEEGTNIFHLKPPKAATSDQVSRLAAKGIQMFPRNTAEGRLVLWVNETILRRPPEEIADELGQAFGGKA